MRKSIFSLVFQTSFLLHAFVFYDSTNQPGRYIVNGDVVQDKLTGLFWEKNVDSKRLNWSATEAVGSVQGYCSNLNLGGHYDWRVPSVVELQSLLDYQMMDSTKINQSVFDIDTRNLVFWTISNVVSLDALAWAVDFENGLVKKYPKDKGLTILCVRGSFVAEVEGDRFVDEDGQPLRIRELGQRVKRGERSDSMFTFDRATKLLWTRGSNPGMSREAAQRACEFLGSGWRLPTVKELTSIVNYSRTLPSANATVFPLNSKYYTYFWTSTPLNMSESAFTVVSFKDGSVENVSRYQDRTCQNPECFVFSRCVMNYSNDLEQ